MRDARIRLLLHPELQDHERKAAAGAARRFGQFGLKAESVQGPDAKVWKDRCRQQVFDLVFGEGKAAIRGVGHFFEPVYPVPNDGAILAGVTVREIAWGGDPAFRGGFSIDGVGCVLSLSGLRASGTPYRGAGPADQHEAAEAIELALTKEIGHSLVGKTHRRFGNEPPHFDDSGYCLSAGCLLENTGDYISYLRKSRSLRADFCGGCMELLRFSVISINHLGCA